MTSDRSLAKAFPFLILVFFLHALSQPAISAAASRGDFDGPWDDSGANDVTLDSLSETPTDSNSTSPASVTSHFHNWQEHGAQLSIRSGARQIKSVDNSTLYAVPILTSQLVATLKAAQADLQKAVNNKTQHYSYNHSDWSLNIVVLNGTLRYSVILAVVVRFLTQAPNPAETNITWARVGVVERGQEPIADVVFLPSGRAAEYLSQEDTVLNTTAPESPDGKIPVLDVSPSGASESLQIIDEHALDFFNPSNSPANSPKKRSLSDIETEFLVNEGMMAFKLTARMRPDFWNGRLIRAAQANTMASTVKLAIDQLGLLYVEDTDTTQRIDKWIFDSGPYRVGQLCARFVMHVAGEYSKHLADYDLALARAWQGAFLGPLKKLKKAVPGLEGEISATVPIDGKMEKVLAGNWTFEIAKAPPVHDGS